METKAAGPQTDSHTRTAARSLAAQGAEAFENADFDKALDLFQRAGALIQAPTIILMEARTLVELKRWVEAADKYSVGKHMQSPEADNDAFQRAVQAAADELEALKVRIPLVTITLQGDADASAAEVWIDGRQLPTALVGVDNPLNPGTHRIEIRSPGRKPIEREVYLREGERQELVVELASERTVKPAAAPIPVLTDSPAPEPSRNAFDTLGWVALGTGTAATLVGVGTGIYALTKKSKLDDICDPGCPGSQRDDIRSFRRYRTLSYAAFGLGVIGVTWGGYVLLADEPERPTVGLYLSPGWAAVEGTF